MTLVLKHHNLPDGQDQRPDLQQSIQEKMRSCRFFKYNYVTFVSYIQTDLVIEIILTCQRGLEESLAES